MPAHSAGGNIESAASVRRRLFAVPSAAHADRPAAAIHRQPNPQVVIRMLKPVARIRGIPYRTLESARSVQLFPASLGRR